MFKSNLTTYFKCFQLTLLSNLIEPSSIVLIIPIPTFNDTEGLCVYQ